MVDCPPDQLSVGDDDQAGARGPAAPEVCDLLGMYRTMRRIRTFEEHVGRHFRSGDIHGFVHVSSGQEAVAAGACGALCRADFVTTTHRGHGHCLAKGAEPAPMMAELFGRASGLCGGRGGSMHLADPALGILGANGIVGAGIPIAAGAALASRVRESGAVAVAFFGEGALHSGAFHEGLILAVAWCLPLVLVCECNGWAEFTAANRWGGPGPAERAVGYGMPAEVVDGGDPIAVRAVVSSAVERARAGGGPSIVEAQTRRLGGHFEGDDQGYRPDEDLAAARGSDPLVRLRARIADAEEELAAIDANVESEMEHAVRVAREAPYPSADQVLEHVEAPASADLVGGPGEAGTYLEMIGRALAHEMERDSDVVLMGIDIGRGGGVYGASTGLLERFGAERVRDTPIAEAGVLGAAVGAAMAGLRPVVEIMYMDFLTVCLDPIVNQAAKLRYMTGGGARLPVVFRTQTGGGRSAGAQHSQSLETLLAHIPGLKVFCPGDARDAYDLLCAAIRDDSPVVFVENRRLYHRRGEDHERGALPPGVSRVVRAGSDLTVVTWGRMVRETLIALESLEGPGADAEVIDLRTLVPLDTTLVAESVRRTGRCLVVHEAVERFGPGAEVVARVVEEVLYELDGPVQRYGAVAAPVPYSPALETAALPTSAGIAERIMAVAVA